MSRLRVQDRVVLAVLLPVWLVCFALFAKERLGGAPAESPLLVAAPERGDAYPTLVRYRPGVAAEEAGALRPGDRLTRVGSVDLRGMDPLRVLAHSYAEADAEGALAVEFERGGLRAAAAVTIRPEEQPWRRLVLAVAFAATAVLVILRAPHSRLAQAVLPAYLALTFTWLLFQGGPPVQTVAYVVVRAVAGCLWAPLMLRAAFVLPEEAAPPRGRLPRWPWLFALLGASWTSMWLDFPFPIAWGQRLNPALGAAVIASILAVLTRNYRRAGPVGRRQVKWVVTGVYLGTVPVLAAVVAAAIDPDLQWLWDWSLIGLLLVPVFTFIAITRSQLLDIDRVISATATYTLLLVIAAAAVLALVPTLGGAAADLAELPPAAGRIGVSLVLAALLVPVAGAVRRRVEELLFVERHALQRGVDRLARDLEGAADADTLIHETGERLDALLRPRCCLIYGRTGKNFEPVFLRGTKVAPVFETDGALAEELAARTSAAGREELETLAPALAPEERAALASLGAEVIVPVSRAGMLVAFVGLGAKRSADVYTATDLALLGVVGAQVSTALRRFDEAALLREARAAQERLREYVPEAVASQLAAGREPEMGEREVSVLFVDIRGYATLTQDRRPSEIFSIVNRYTETVSHVVREHGGTVVEFNGDGMMAVFGAPGTVRAARLLVEEVKALGRAPGESTAGPLRVGVGIATGEAYVGAIRSVDRLIWSAIGSTTNLAARLEELTRELEAQVVLDETTRSRAGKAAEGFARRTGLAIRGLRGTRNLWVWSSGS
jgi:class 3 adenylate cyclase